jgi:hypothetical protein
MLTLSQGGQSGFSEQDLQSDLSAFNPASVNQWWTQTTANASNGFASFLSNYQSMTVAIIAVAIIMAIAATVVAKRKGTKLRQPGLPSTKKSVRSSALTLRPKGVNPKK